MKKRSFSFFFLFFVCLGSLSAQAFNKATFSRKVPSLVRKEISVQDNIPDTLKILAVMVEFAEDKDASTYGNGKFGTIYSSDKNYGNTILDPLPHDKNYFSRHLEFAENYYKKVSHNKFNISYDILPGIVTVSGLMRSYSPSASSSDLTLLGNLSKEVWSLTAAQNQGLDFSKYDLFVIFHAGVGRDISLPGSIGNERDLPSVYLGDKALRNLFNNNLSGFPLNRSNKINTMIVPETESREMSSLGITTLVQITINGLLVANIASHLGLPDLFDTKTGKSAIGRFGLMDGQAIFAYNGIFPPEPSAWEKIFLGWEKPVVSNLQEGTAFLTTAASASGNDTTIFKVPINSDEYFLLENRERDAKKNGSVLTYVLGGETFQKTISRDTTGYFSYDTDSLRGVITDVDEFDWALPGSGILIWHIDDKIINSKINNDQINADLNNRGVFLEEADGIQDIGQEFTTLLGDVAIGEGDSVDLWYGSNKSRLFKNQFTPESTPNSNSNSGANSLIYISDFSNRSNKMSFNIRFNDGSLNLFSRVKLPMDLKSAEFYLNPTLTGNNFLLRLNNSDAYLFSGEGKVLGYRKNFSKTRSAFITIDGISYMVGVYDNFVNIWNVTKDSLFTFNLNEVASTPPVIVPESSVNGSESSIGIYAGTEKGKIFKINFGIGSLSFNISNTITFDSNLLIKQIALDGQYLTAYAANKNTLEYFFLDNLNNSIKINSTIHDLILSKENNKYVSILISTNGDINLISEGQIIDHYNTGDSLKSGSVAVGNIKNDGENYIVYNSGNTLKVRTLSGAVADNFPFSDPNKTGFSGTPLIGTFNGNKNAEIITTTNDGRIYAIDAISGKVLSGFPLTVGTSISVNPLFFNTTDSKGSFAIISDSSTLSLFRLGNSIVDSKWAGDYGNDQNTAFVDAASSENKITTFFPDNRIYNWPNPVYGEETFIRYYVSEDSRINIKIFDLAGDFVEELNDNARGGFDSETKWNIKNIQSGIYLARVEATGNSGSKGFKIIKIAVVK